jgi:catechol 2,3-dioxygenase-like lactoylglutathione lyase family enzyme
MSAFTLNRIHHVAYRCRDAKETVDWYARVLGMTYTNAFARIMCCPQRGRTLYAYHLPLIDCGSGNAFFELPNQPAMGRA